MLLWICGNSNFAQSNSISLCQDKEYKVEFVLLKSPYAYLLIKSFRQDNFLLGKFELKNDTLFFNEVDDNLIIDTEYFFTQEEISNDSLNVQFSFRHLFNNCGSSTYERLNCIVSKDSRQVYSTVVDRSNFIYIPKIKGEINLKLYNNDSLLYNFTFTVPNGNNMVGIKVKEFFSLPPDFFEKSSLPNRISFGGANYVFKPVLSYEKMHLPHQATDK